MGVKFGMEERISPDFDKCVGPQKLIFLLIFDQNVDYKLRAYPLREFHKICRMCTTFQDAFSVKISLAFLKELWCYGVLSRGGLVTPQIFSSP